jgi:hypothetical protein
VSTVAADNAGMLPLPLFNRSGQWISSSARLVDEITAGAQRLNVNEIRLEQESRRIKSF